ncbi:MAG: aldose 1-epimerase [Alphaproteobacteria bacterium]|nr:aldose 1-epimerase [Alphaproteobacteria bacterium]
MNTLVTLSRGPLALTLAPGCGGSITHLQYYKTNGEKIPCLRAVETTLDDALDGACFPLVPYVNRIGGGRFVFGGKEVTLPRNLDGDPSPLHGHGWRASWKVARQEQAEAELVYRHDADEWPWDYEARQVFTLEAAALIVRLSCTNRSDALMPCGLGLHPYFNCGPETLLDAIVESAWTIDEHALPVEKVSATGRYDLRSRRICGQDLDHGFGGWSGRARIDDPALPFALALSAEGTRFLHIYSPPEGGFFAAEPVSHANGALGAPESEWDALGLNILGPGESMAIGMRIDLAARQ